MILIWLVISDETNVFSPMLDMFVFVPGSQGGTKVILKANKKAEENSFYMEDGEKAIIVVDLLQDNLDKNLGVEFFLSLLNDLNQFMEHENSEELELDAKLDDAEKDGEEKLLQLERDLDQTMMNLRRKLMVIKLLELLSEDNELQEQVLKNSMRLIQFLLLTFQRCAKLCVSRQDNQVCS